ncbi:hypothetical protein, partial [Tabrizicola sp.]|uniref:hypothetical protein n=1 Tax=Tabrizicola sp. TaxID=2005166 RepID=UPI003F2D68D5
ARDVMATAIPTDPILLWQADSDGDDPDVRLVHRCAVHDCDLGAGPFRSDQVPPSTLCEYHQQIQHWRAGPGRNQPDIGMIHG